jgi:natural product precursor
MKKIKLLNLGKSLTRDEMKKVNGGLVNAFTCYCDGYNMGSATSIAQCLGICQINGC